MPAFFVSSCLCGSSNTCHTGAAFVSGLRASNRTGSRRVFGQPSDRRKHSVRAGLSARVSTHDQQTLSLQRSAMRDYYADRRGWAIAIEVKEVGSGASLRELREKLLEAARRGDIDVVVVWRLDRWGAAAVRRIPGVSFRIRSCLGFSQHRCSFEKAHRSNADWGNYCRCRCRSW